MIATFCNHLFFPCCPIDLVYAFPWQANAQKIAEFLVAHPLIVRVNYAGLPKHTGRDLHYSQVCLLARCLFYFIYEQFLPCTY